MKIKVIDADFSVCKVNEIAAIDLTKDYYFIGRTDEENSLVCMTNDVPNKTIAREDGWKCFRIKGVLDFSLIGILAKISTILADNQIGIFVISTYNTDYVLTKTENFSKALKLLADHGYDIC